MASISSSARHAGPALGDPRSHRDGAGRTSVERRPARRRRRRSCMASNAKKRTTMAKLNREQKLREKRASKMARKELRREEAATASTATEPVAAPDGADEAGT